MAAPPAPPPPSSAPPPPRGATGGGAGGATGGAPGEELHGPSRVVPEQAAGQGNKEALAAPSSAPRPPVTLPWTVCFFMSLTPRVE